MRIIGGSKRGHPLITPTGQDIRPTSDKVRLAIFNALYSRGGVVDKIIIDAFAGTGALGCEALSQGARYCHFFDISRTSLALTQKNISALGFNDQSALTSASATGLPARAPSQQAADIVFIDPPYRHNLILPTIESLKKGMWLQGNTLLVIESEKECPVPTEVGVCDFDKNYGDTRVRMMRV